MRLITNTVVWLLLLIFWLPLLMLDLFQDAESFGPGAATPYAVFASLGTVVWIVPLFALTAPSSVHFPISAACIATSVLYLVIGGIALWKLEIGPIRPLRPR